MGLIDEARSAISPSQAVSKVSIEKKRNPRHVSFCLDFLRLINHCFIMLLKIIFYLKRIVDGWSVKIKDAIRRKAIFEFI